MGSPPRPLDANGEPSKSRVTLPICGSAKFLKKSPYPPFDHRKIGDGGKQRGNDVGKQRAVEYPVRHNQIPYPHSIDHDIQSTAYHQHFHDCS